MAFLENLQFHPCGGDDDPDDYRPRSSWAVAVDPPASDRVYVQDLCAYVDVAAPGDRVPLHSHPVSELIVLEEGTVEFTLGDETRRIATGAMVFVPADTPHGARNIGTAPARFLGVFPTERFEFCYLERNPAPGTEGEPPQPPFELDARA